MVMQSYISYISIYNESVKSKIHYKFKSIFSLGDYSLQLNVAMETWQWKPATFDDTKDGRTFFLFYPIDSPAMLPYIYEKNIYG